MSMLIARDNPRPGHELDDALPGRSREAAALTGRDPDVVDLPFVERAGAGIGIEVPGNV